MTVLALAVVAALLGGAVCFAIAAPGRRAALPSRFLVIALIGLVVGELISMVALSGSIDERLRADAETAASSAPAVRAAQAELASAAAARAALDGAVDEASTRRDQALVVARCEYRPDPACPQTTITGVPGQGPETRTANERLAAAQADLDRATAARAARTPDADAGVTKARGEVESARAGAVAAADDGVGARWVALNHVTGGSLGAAAPRGAIDLLCVVLALLPLMLRLWRGDTARDIRARQVLESERMAAAAQIAIDRRQQEHRVELALAAEPPTARFPSVAALDAAGFEPVEVSARRYLRDAPDDDGYLPIAAAAEAASLAAMTPTWGTPQPGAVEMPTRQIPTRQIPRPAQEATVPDETTNLPVPAAAAEPALQGREVERKPNPFVPPVLDDAARAVAGFVLPLVPPIVGRVLGSVPGARLVQQSYEEVEEVTFSMRRTRKVTVGTVEQTVPAPASESDGGDGEGTRPGRHHATAVTAGYQPDDEPLDVAHEPLPAHRRRELR